MQRNRRIVDISPPKKKEEIKLQKKNRVSASRKKFPVFWVAVLFIFVVPVVSFLVIQFFFSFATITLWPQTRSISLSDIFLVRQDAPQIDFANKLIPGKIFQVEKSATKLYSTTGLKTQDIKAQGTIRVFNNQAKIQILIATTRFISQDGKLFRSTERVAIQPGVSLDVHVAAAEAGEGYNIGSSNFSLPGLVGTPLYTLVYGKSSQSMAGGTHSKVSIVSEADIAQAKNSLVNDLANLAKGELQKQLVSPYVMENSSSRSETLEALSLVKEGAELAQFSVKAKVRLTVLAFQRPQAEELARHLVEAQLSNAEAEKINPKSFQAAFTPKTFEPDLSQLSLNVTMAAKAYEEIDLNALRTKVQGQKKIYAKEILSEYPNLSKSQVSLWPFWTMSVPQDARKIHINISLD